MQQNSMQKILAVREQKILAQALRPVVRRAPHPVVRPTGQRTLSGNQLLRELRLAACRG
jgi:hypothetical protein